MNVNFFEQKLTEWIYLTDGENLWDQTETKINCGTNVKSHN